MNILYSMLKDSHDNSVSSKRVITFLAFVLCATAFISNLFWKFQITQFIYDSMIYLAMAGLGVTAAEKFASKSDKEEK